MKHVNNTKVIDFINGNQGVVANVIAKHFDIPYHFVKNKIKELYQEGVIFRQIKGHTYLLYTTWYAMEHSIPEVWVDETLGETRVDQMWFNSLIMPAVNLARAERTLKQIGG